MLPDLFRISDFPVRTYGILLVLGVLVAVWIAKKRAPMFGIKPEKVWDSSMWLVIPGILGARLFYVVQHWSYYQEHREELFSLRFEGLTSFGGIVFGFLGFLVWRRRADVPFWGFLDTVGVPVLVAQAIGRIGCLMNGCCYGRPTEAWYGVFVLDLGNKHVPAQLVDTALMLLGGLLITVRERRSLMRPGASFGWFLIVYGVSRFVYEFFRAGTQAEFNAGIASSVRLPGLPITSAQAVTIGLIVLGAVCLVLTSRKENPSPVTTD